MVFILFFKLSCLLCFSKSALMSYYQGLQPLNSEAAIAQHRMGRKEKQNAKAIDEEHDVVNFNGASTPSLVFSSDDDEANQDLSLKIVEKAMRMRAAKHAPNDDVSSPFSQKSELAVPLNDVVSDLPSAIADSEVTEKKKTAKLKREAAGDQSVSLIPCLAYSFFE